MPPSGTADSPICQSNVGGYTHYSATIRYNPGIGKREDQSDVQTSNAGKDVALEKRQDFVVLGFALVAGGYSATFITDAIDTCGALEIDKKKTSSMAHALRRRVLALSSASFLRTECTQLARELDRRPRAQGEGET